MKRLLIAFLLAVSIFSFSCSRIADTQDSSLKNSGSVTSGTASIKVSELLKTDSPVKIYAVIENNGKATAYNLVYTVKPRRGITVLESHTVTSNITLEPTKYTVAEVVFSTLSSHKDYDDIVFDFSWTESKQGTISMAALIK